MVNERVEQMKRQQFISLDSQFINWFQWFHWIFFAPLNIFCYIKQFLFEGTFFKTCQQQHLQQGLWALFAVKNEKRRGGIQCGNKKCLKLNKIWSTQSKECRYILIETIIVVCGFETLNGLFWPCGLLPVVYCLECAYIVLFRIHEYKIILLCNMNT